MVLVLHRCSSTAGGFKHPDIENLSVTNIHYSHQKHINKGLEYDKVGTKYMTFSNHHPKYEFETVQMNLIVDSVFQNTPFDPLNFKCTVVCEKPNNKLNNFNGFL